MPALLPAFLLLCGVFPRGDTVLITRAGEKVEGAITHANGEYAVETAAGIRRFPESQVGLVFENLREVLERADDRYREAKRLYEEARLIDESHPDRNRKLSMAIEIAQGAVTTYQMLQPHYAGPSHASIPSGIQVMMQFIRLCRGAATAEATIGTAAGTATRVALEEPRFAFTPPPARPEPWMVTGELGPGLVSAARDLPQPDAARRLEAVKRLTHPPSPLHLPLLLRTFEAETDPAVLRALAEGFGFMDLPAVLKSMAWAKRETEPSRREAAFQILRTASDRAALDFAVDWFEESPPASHPDRAAFASLFRQYRTLSVLQLKDLLAKNRNPKVQSEAIRQLGAVGDKAAGPMLLKTLSTYPRDSAASLLKLGKPCIPTLLEGARSSQADLHRICAALLRRLTGIQQPNLVHFETWWAQNHKGVQEEERSWWEEQARKGWPVEPAAFSLYDQPLEGIVP